MTLQAEAQLSVRQRFRIAKAHSRRLLAKEWDESKHPRVPAGGPDGGQFGSGGGGAESSTDSTSKPGKSKKPAKKEDFDKAKIGIRVLGDSSSKGEQEFIEKWNEKVGIEPEQFKKSFLGGTEASMTISGYRNGTKFEVKGDLYDKDPEDDGRIVGNYEREIDLDAKKAYSAYFKLEKAATKHDTGKKVLAGNVEMYKQLGIENVGVTANIDVGGYAWAKYGYVPTQAAWDRLRGTLESKLTGAERSSRPTSSNTIEADDWNMLSSDVQSDVRDHWMRDSREEFISSEEQNWRESGQAKDDAKYELAFNYNDKTDVPQWVTDSMDATRQRREDEGEPPIPYTNKQLYDAIELDYSRDGEGGGDPDISFDDDKLKQPAGYDSAQGTLPGIEPLDPASFLTAEMREQISGDLTDSFNEKAESDADDLDPPSYLADNVDEYMDDYWNGKSDREMLQHALDYGMADIEIEPDEEEEAPQQEMELPPKIEDDPVLAALRNPDPKSIWKVADSPQGKKLLLGTGWSGNLNLKDRDQMDRFNKYVGGTAHG